MVRSPQRLALGLVGAAMVILPAAWASACVAVVSLTNSPGNVQPGGTLSTTGREFAQDVPVTIHLDSPTGPVLATAPPPESTMDSSFTIDVPIPANITPGQHVLVAKQDHHDMNTGQPARTVFFVGAAPPTTAAPAPRPLGLAAASGPSAPSLILIGLGVMVAGLLLAGLWALANARRAGGGGGGPADTSAVTAS